MIAPFAAGLLLAMGTVDSSTISGLGLRNIGSATMSGRISAVAGRHEKDGKVTLYVGAASGGVWKSSNGGTTFEPVFDKEPVQSIGAIALDPSHPQTVWVGTGESWTRNSVSIGNGIYKSTDGGETWTNTGLPQSERVSRIVVNPKNGDIVYACVPGKLWSDSPDRGLYRTTDGGAHWTLVLKGSNLSTGCSTVAMDPRRPNVLIAGLWDFRRKGWTFRSGGDGPTAYSGSALYRSADGGNTWTALTAARNHGLPQTPWGRIEVAIAPSNPNMVYAFIENRRSALYVSQDGGRTWDERDRSQRMVWRPFYFARLVVDPKNDQRVFKTNLGLIVSDDGGRSFAPASDAAGHGDWHDLWIDPADPKRVIGGDDGGLWLSYDGGSRWWKAGNLPLSQFYHVSVDDADPYHVFGGMQDNGVWTGDSAYPGGIPNGRWNYLNGGDGFWAFPDPTDPNFAYAESQGGAIVRVDRRTLESRDIQPRAGYDEKLRYNWNTPIALSPSAPSTIYIGAQFLFRSSDRGQTWQRISPDLTTNDPQKQKQEQSGGITVDNSAAEQYTTIYAIAESPKSGSTIWVGTDDGNVAVTRDGGTNWMQVGASLPHHADGNWISSVEASRTDEGTAYVTIDRHTFGDMSPYAYKTTDFGKTWTELAGPATAGVRGYAHVIREDPVNPTLLYLGTEFGIWVSVDAGRTWAEFKPSDFPSVAVRDVVVQPRDGDLVLATHGRGIWILDDVTPLRALASAPLGSGVAFVPGRPVQQRIEAGTQTAPGDAVFFGDDPIDGAVISYYLPRRAVIGKLTVEVLDAEGKVVASIPAGKRKGINRVVWSMQTKPPIVPPAASLAGSSTQGQRYLPGAYTIKLTRGSEVLAEPLTVTLDRRVSFTLADRRAQFDAAEQVKGLFARMSRLFGKIAALRGSLARAQARVAEADPLHAQLVAIAARNDALRKTVVATTEGGAVTGEERLREKTDDLFGLILSTEQAPPATALARIDALDHELGDVEKGFADLTGGADFTKLNDALRARNMPALSYAAARVQSDGSYVSRAALESFFEGEVGSRLRSSVSSQTEGDTR